MSEREMWAMENGAVLYNVHPESQCAGTPCWIHHPTDHHMRDWPMVRVRTRQGTWLYRECLHGAVHLDPDEEWFLQRILHLDTTHSHDCDGCCSVTTEGERDGLQPRR